MLLMRKLCSLNVKDIMAVFVHSDILKYRASLSYFFNVNFLTFHDIILCRYRRILVFTKQLFSEYLFQFLFHFCQTSQGPKKVSSEKPDKIRVTVRFFFLCFILFHIGFQLCQFFPRINVHTMSSVLFDLYAIFVT